MAGDFREQLAAVTEQEHKLVFYEHGCKHPPYNELDVQESYVKFCAEVLPLSPITDPRGKKIKIIENNFPKLLNLEPKKQGDPARPIVLVRMLKSNTLDLTKYAWERDRIMDLFWVCDVLREPDAIYANGHKVVIADEVYVKVYDKMGSKVKLAFIGHEPNKSAFIVTSYLCTPNRAVECIKGKPIWQKKKE